MLYSVYFSLYKNEKGLGNAHKNFLHVSGFPELGGLGDAEAGEDLGQVDDGVAVPVHHRVHVRPQVRVVVLGRAREVEAQVAAVALARLGDVEQLLVEQQLPVQGLVGNLKKK